MDAQADLRPRWVHSHFVGFVMKRLIYDCAVVEMRILVYKPPLLSILLTAYVFHLPGYINNKI